jgi:hypothetical protein
MKNEKKVLVIGILIFLLLMQVCGFALSEREKNKHKEEVELMIAEAHYDIMSKYESDKEFNAYELDDFYDKTGKGDIPINEDLRSSIIEAFHSIKMPKGAIYPIFIMDETKLLTIAYKCQDGVDVYHKFEFNNGKYLLKDKTYKKGKIVR